LLEDAASCKRGLGRGTEPDRSALFAATEEAVEAPSVGSLDLKGFARPVLAYEVRRLR
jgi:class 3 adenylate cyclase